MTFSLGPCNEVQFAPGYVSVSQCESVKMTRSNATRRSSNGRSGGAMGEEDSKTAKSEFRLGMICIVQTEFIYS